MKATTLMALLCIAAFSPAQAGTIGVDPTSGGTGLGSGFGGLTLGWEFQVSSTNGITVDGLGFWDYQADGFFLGQTFPVGLWDSVTGTLLRNTVVTSASTLKTSLHTDGDWRVNSVSPVFLAPGLYRIGALMPVSGANPTVGDAATIQSEPEVTLVRYLRQLGSPTLAMPDTPPSASDSAYFGPTFTFIPGSGVVNPARAVVAPSGYTETGGNTGVNTLVRDSGVARTYQMQFSPAALGGLPVGALITELQFRLSTNSAPPTSFPADNTSWSDYEVTLAQAANPIPTMSFNFAANMFSPVRVKDGALSLSANSFTTSLIPHPFHSFVVFDTPYVYQGGDLVMLFSHTGSDSVTNAFLDAASSSSPGFGTDFRAVSASSFNATSGVQASVTIVQIVFAPPISQTIFLNDTSVVIAGTGGSPGGPYRILTSTNSALPLSQWKAAATNLFDGSGSFRYTKAIHADWPVELFRIALP